MNKINNSEIANYYIICSTQRSGSSLLCHLLRQCKVFGRPGEIFGKPKAEEQFKLNHGIDNESYDYFVKKVQEKWSSNLGVFGFKAHYHQFEKLLKNIDFNNLFPKIKYIYIDRKDLLEQTISLTRAKMSGSWSTEHSRKEIERFDYNEINKAFEDLFREKLLWERYFCFCDINPLRIFYEDILADEKNEVLRIAEWLGIEVDLNMVDISRVNIKKQRDNLTELWKKEIIKREQEKWQYLV